MNLKSEPAKPPGPKPVIKQWVDQYNKQEQEAIINSTAVTKENSSEIDALINSLYASDGPITTFIKKSLYQQILPQSHALIIVQGDDLVNKLEFARVASSILNKFIDSKTIICSNEDNVEIQTLTCGSPLVVNKALQGLCDFVTDGIKIKTDIDINTLIISGVSSKLSEINFEDLMRNNRTFNLNLGVYNG